MSILIAALAFAVFSALAVVIFRGMSARNLLESKNDCERTINTLLSSLRDYESFGAAIEDIPPLRQKIIGISLFDSAQKLLYTWGTAPADYPSVQFLNNAPRGLMEEIFVGDPKDNSQIVYVRPPQQPQPSPPSPQASPPPPRDDHHQNTFTSTVFRQADLIYFKIRQPQYWHEKRLQTLLFPLSELLLLLLVGFVWLLYIKNAEYRQGAERQKNLVMLGTAASTLAHEIKNPLLAIRLQTEILARAFSGDGERELAIIDDEVERLTRLTTRVNDVLRDPTGSSEVIEPGNIVSETSVRLCGRPIVSVPAGQEETRCTVRIDPERLRSIMENLIANALESGGPQEEVAVEIAVDGVHVHIDVLDRGPGMPANERERAFDPFFTTKSRGTGIGLVICRRFARAAGGDVTLEDRPGGGLRARLSLPRTGL